jgi:hypothetical protein
MPITEITASLKPLGRHVDKHFDAAIGLDGLSDRLSSSIKERWAYHHQALSATALSLLLKCSTEIA